MAACCQTGLPWAEFVHTDIGHEFGDEEEPIIILIRHNLWQALIDMITNGEQEPVLYAAATYDPDANCRVYNEFWTADRWQQLQVTLSRDKQCAGALQRIHEGSVMCRLGLVTGYQYCF